MKHIFPSKLSKNKLSYSILRILIRQSDDPANIEKLKSDRETTQKSLKQIRKEIRLCESIQKRSEALEAMRDQPNYAIAKKEERYR